jgi:DNA-binding NarL/FixJ family response regulator
MSLQPETEHAISKLAQVAASVLIVDDHAVFRGDARELLEVAGYRVVGEASDGAQAVTMARRLQPDVVLLDVQLPDRDGFAIAEELAVLPSPPRVVLISSRQAADYGSRLRTAHVVGFIHKPELSRARIEELVGTPG